MHKKGIVVAALLLLPAAISAAEWRSVTSIDGVYFQKAKREQNGLTIGLLETDTKISGRLCRRGWVHLHPNGVVARFTSAEAIVLPQLRIPEGTWVGQDDTGAVTMCAFPSDTEVHGIVCRGTGGAKGVQVAFYPNGTLKQFYLTQPTRIDGVLCDSGTIRGWVEQHENGRLKSCLLAEDHEQAGRQFRRGTRIEFDEAGRVQSR